MMNNFCFRYLLDHEDNFFLFSVINKFLSFLIKIFALTIVSTVLPDFDITIFVILELFFFVSTVNYQQIKIFFYFVI